MDKKTQIKDIERTEKEQEDRFDFEEKIIEFLQEQPERQTKIAEQLYWLSDSESKEKKKLEEKRNEIYKEVSEEVNEDGKKIFSNKELRDAETDRRMNIRNDVVEIYQNLESITEKKSKKQREFEEIKVTGRNYRCILNYLGGVTDES